MGINQILGSWVKITVDANKKVSKIQGVSGHLGTGYKVGDTLTGGSSGAAYVIETIDGIEGISSNDEFADNDIFETLGNNFVDFSEINPFGEI